jgi:cyanobactin maturation PatA/PatG family protease
LVYALGQVGYDLVNEARRDALVQALHPKAKTPAELKPFSTKELLDYLAKSPWDAAAVEWTLNLDGTPIYAVRPQGPFAADAYRRLRELLGDQLDQGAERVAIPGRITGTTTLLTGQVVPVIDPEIRGMSSWATQALTDEVAGKPADERLKAVVRDFLERVYHELRNPGLTPRERALNYAATNAFQVGQIGVDALKAATRMELDSVRVSRSPLCRPHADCWDVEIYFFAAENVQAPRRVHRFTVDVSDVVPVLVGPVRSWSTR